MRNEDHSFTVRLDTGYEDEKQAWDKLKRLQRKTHLSYNRIVTDAVNAYETDFVHLAPEDEARIIQQRTLWPNGFNRFCLPIWPGTRLGQLLRLQCRLFLKWQPKIKQFTPNPRTPMKLTMISAEA